MHYKILQVQLCRLKECTCNSITMGRYLEESGAIAFVQTPHHLRLSRNLLDSECGDSETTCFTVMHTTTVLHTHL